MRETTRCGQAAESERSRIITALHRYEKKARANGSGLRSYRCVRTHGYMTRQLLVEIDTTFSLPKFNTGPVLPCNICSLTRHSFIIHRGLKSRNLFVFPDFNQLASWRIRKIVYFLFFFLFRSRLALML